MVKVHGAGWGELLIGTESADDLFGEGGDDSLHGLEGDDFLKGGEDDDRIFGGEDDDVLVSGEHDARITPPNWTGLPGLDKPDGGDDEMFGGSGNDRLIVTTDSFSVLVDGGTGTDTLQIGFDDAQVADTLANGGPAFTQTAAIVDLQAGFGTYRFNGQIIALNLTISEIENVDGSAFNETISGTDSVNILNGELGNDILRGRGGADTLNGGSGNDTATYDDSTAAVDVDLTRTTQLGGDAQGDRLISIENLTGSNFADALRGNSAANIIDGGGGNDTLEGRAGADTINGGAGSDTASYQSSQARVVVDLRSDEAQHGGDAEGDILTSIENVTGSMWDDVLTGTDNNNVLSGGFSNDVLFGLGGSDTLEGGLGNDTLDGGAGTDMATYADATSGVQVTLGLNGADGRVRASFPVNDVDTLRSIEQVTGSNFDDAFYGNEQANLFRGLNGNDFFLESRGNDTYVGDAGIDTLDLGSETSGVSVNLAAGGMTHVGTTEQDSISSTERIVGTRFDDSIIGSAADEFLFGGGGNDILRGAGGEDEITGGSGADSLTGGSGADSFLFRSVNEFSGDTRLDLIEDFQVGLDKIDLSAIDADVISDGNQAFTLVNEFTGVAGQMRIRAITVDGRALTVVSVDIDGDPGTDHLLLVDTHGQALGANDFVL